MKKLIFICLLVASVAHAGGVSVTNGQSVYHSPVGFAVSYSKTLTLDVKSDALFEISNSQLVGANDQLSKISFNVEKDVAKSPRDVLALMQKQFAGRNLQPVKEPGARGYFWEDRTPDQLTAQYDLLTTNGDLVEVSIEAYAAANGIALMAPIVNSFVYDATAPTLQEIRAESLVWKTGSKQTVHLRITDDYSGLEEISCITLNRVRKGTNKIIGNNIFPDIKLKHETGDWYAWTFTVGKYLESGSYQVSDFYMADRADNQQTVRVNEKSPNFYEHWQDPQSDKPIPVLKVRIVNEDSTDVEVPVFHGFRPDASVWETGSTHRIYFKITDNVSGVKVGDPMLCFGQLVSLFTQNGRRFQLDSQCFYRAEGNDWYSTEVFVKPYVPSGEYFASWINYGDRADNENMREFDPNDKTTPHDAGLVSTFKVKIHNAGAADITPPELLDWRVDTNVWPVGSTQTLHIRVTDDLSGFAKNAESFSGFIISSNDGASQLDTNSDFKAEGGGWFGAQVKVSPFEKGGDFHLSFISLQDAVGNEVRIDCKDATPACTVRGGGALNLPLLKIQVVR